MLPHSMTRRRFGTAVGLGGLTLSGTGVATARSHNRNFRAHLSGENEVHPVETNAQGQANFQLDKAGGELDYKLMVANIDDVVAAHIHCAPVGQNGPVGVTLFSGGPTSDNGILAEGTITAPDDRNGCGWETLADVVEAVRSGNAYVNVHTSAHPAGEIRGQVH
ncbi:CHRD domain-containing protein [Halogeometricum pallidum]|nr:CHRD domain-containing protein [Halogeometricum pallidum]